MIEEQRSPNTDPLLTGRILIVDDDLTNVSLLESMLRGVGATDVHSTTDSRETVDLVSTLKPDILLLDLRMPHPDGYEILDHLAPHREEEGYFPILVLTADATPEAMERALQAGALDFLTKPLNITEVLLRIRNLLHTRELYKKIQDYNLQLEKKVRERTSRLRDAHTEILDRLAHTAEYRDDQTGEHTRRVGKLSALLAKELGLPQAQVDMIRKTAPLHDIGKIGIQDAILRKPGPLTDDEWAVMMTHSVIGDDILSGSKFSSMEMGRVIARSHHERWDGDGYPDGLASEDIPLVARIVQVVDIFDALTHDRPYKKAWPLDKALIEIEAAAGTQCDPKVVEALMTVAERDSRLAQML